MRIFLSLDSAFIELILRAIGNNKNGFITLLSMFYNIEDIRLTNQSINNII